MFSVAQAGLDLIVILLPQLPKLWDYGCATIPSSYPQFWQPQVSPDITRSGREK